MRFSKLLEGKLSSLLAMKSLQFNGIDVSAENSYESDRQIIGINVLQSKIGDKHSYKSFSIKITEGRQEQTISVTTKIRCDTQCLNEFYIELFDANDDICRALIGTVETILQNPVAALETKTHVSEELFWEGLESISGEVIPFIREQPGSKKEKYGKINVERIDYDEIREIRVSEEDGNWKLGATAVVNPERVYSPRDILIVEGTLESDEIDYKLSSEKPAPGYDYGSVYIHSNRIHLTAPDFSLEVKASSNPAARELLYPLSLPITGLVTRTIKDPLSKIVEQTKSNIRTVKNCNKIIRRLDRSKSIPWKFAL